jgi:sugar/nucleoside kinase (ribokinase family)
MIDVILKSDQRMVNTLEVDGTNYFHSSRIVHGGSGNVAAALSHLGAKVALIGKAGDDVYGRAYVQDLESLNISPAIEFDNSVSTGFTVSLVESEGHRTMLVSRGANDNLTPQELKKHLRHLGPAKFVYLSGYSLLNLPQREAILEAGRMGRESGSQIVFDPGSSNLIMSLSEVFQQAIESCDVLCANLAESKVLADGLDVSEYAKLLSRRGKKVIIKTGREGCLVSSAGDMSKVPGVPATSVDTTGAGDAFLGALLYCLSLDRDLALSASFANWFAARKIEGLGPRHFASKADSDAMLKSSYHETILERDQSRI